MSSVAFGLFKALIEQEVPFSSLKDYNITEEHFKDKEVEAYNFIKDFVLDYGVSPRLDTIGRHIGLPEVFNKLPEVSEDFGYWIHQVVERKRYEDIRECMLDMRGCLENQKLEDALRIMGNKYISIRDTYTTRRITPLREVQREVLHKHDTFQRQAGLAGISFGFPFIDKRSGGAQNGDYIIIVGQTGVGKTYLALKVGLSAHNTGSNILFLSTEMPNLQAARRVLAMEGQFSADDLKKGRLSYFGRMRADEIISRGITHQGVMGNYFHLLPGGMFPTVEDFSIVVKELKPDMAIIDGAYLLQATARTWWEKNMEVAMTLKNLSLVEDIPILATYQYLKKDVGKVEGVGGGFAIPQIASMVLSFEYERKEDMNSSQEVQYRVLRLTKGRDGEFGSIRVKYDMKTSQLIEVKVLKGAVEEDELVETDDTPEMDSQDYAEI